MSRLASRRSVLRAQAIERLAEVRTPGNVAAIEEALTDRSPEVRMRAIETIGRLTDGKHEALVRGLDDPNFLVGDRSVLPDALRLVENGDYRVRCAAASALASTFLNRNDREEIVAALQSRLRREKSVATREALARSLAKLARARQ